MPTVERCHISNGDVPVVRVWAAKFSSNILAGTGSGRTALRRTAVNKDYPHVCIYAMRGGRQRDRQDACAKRRVNGPGSLYTSGH